MAGTILTRSVTATHTMRYMFQCEHCGITTPWYDIKIIRKVDSSAYRMADLKSEAKLHKAAKRQIGEHIQWLRQEVEKGNYPKDYSLKKDESDGGANPDFFNISDSHETLFAQQKCPYCQQIQSWAMPALKNDGKLSLILFGIGSALAFGITTLYTNLSENEFKWVYLLIWLGGGIIGALVGWLIKNRKLKEIENLQKTVVTKNKPIIDWNANI